jgi:pimeloyl-[acyl-carrier protein] methyl ester esterase
MFSQVGVNGMKGLVVIDQPPTDIQSQDFPNALISLEGLAQWCYQVQTDRNNFISGILPMLFAEPLAPEDFEWMFDELTRPPGVVAAATLMDQSLRDYREALKGYPVPTLICRGAKSPEPAEGADMIAAAVRQARVHVFENSAHSPFLEEAEEFNGVVTDFVESL